MEGKEMIKKILIAVAALSLIAIIITAVCLFIFSYRDDAQGSQSSNETSSNSITDTNSSTNADNNGETTYDMYGYKFVFKGDADTRSTNDGSVFYTNKYNIFAYKVNYLVFTTWESVVEQTKSEMSTALYRAYSFRARKQEAKAESPFTNSYGVKMMRVTGNFNVEYPGKTDDDKYGTLPYIAYYYITDDNYIRFIICTGYQDENEAAKYIDYVANHLQKL